MGGLWSWLSKPPWSGTALINSSHALGRQMKAIAESCLRWSAVCGLVALLAVLIPITWIAEKTTGGSLCAAKWAKARLDQLKRGA